MSTTATIATKYGQREEALFVEITEQLAVEFNDYRASIAAMGSGIVDLVMFTYDLLDPTEADPLAEATELTLVDPVVPVIELVPDELGTHGVMLSLVDAYAA